MSPKVPKKSRLLSQKPIQIFIRKEPSEAGPTTSRNLGRKIIICLAYSDLLASIGIFVRSALWRFIYLTPVEDESHSILFCLVSSAWVQFFYTATWLWTLSYAINMRRALMEQSSLERQYHMFVWTTASILTAIGCGVLYLPDAECHDIYDLTEALLRVLPNYIMSYGPIIVIMIVNPILYYSSCQEVDRQLISRYSQYTNNERSIKNSFRIKFSLINLIFYICWLPNLINGFLIWTLWVNIPARVMIITWYLEAILNPLQAFLNCLVYRKWTNKNSIRCMVEKFLTWRQVRWGDPGFFYFIDFCCWFFNFPATPGVQAWLQWSNPTTPNATPKFSSNFRGTPAHHWRFS